MRGSPTGRTDRSRPRPYRRVVRRRVHDSGLGLDLGVQCAVAIRTGSGYAANSGFSAERGAMTSAGIVTTDVGVFEEMAAGSPPAVKALALAARALIFQVEPRTVELVWPRQRTAGYGTGPKKLSEHFCWLAPYQHHLTFGFSTAPTSPTPKASSSRPSTSKGRGIPCGMSRSPSPSSSRIQPCGRWSRTP